MSMSTKDMFFIWFKLWKFQQFEEMVLWIGTEFPLFKSKRCASELFSPVKSRVDWEFWFIDRNISCSLFSGWLSEKYVCVKLQRRNRYFPRKFRFIAGILNLEFPFVADSRNICSNGSLMNICERIIPMFLPWQKCGIITQNSQQQLRESRCW